MDWERVSSIPQRLQEAMEKANKKQIDVVNETGLSKSSISRYISGEFEPKSNAIYKLAKALDVSEMWLCGYNCPMERLPNILSIQKELTETSNYAPGITDDVVTFPILGEVAAGYDCCAVEDWSGESIDIPREWLHGQRQDDFFVLRVKGDSMYPSFQNKDIVLIKKQTTLNRSGEIGVVIYNDECASLKKVEYVMGEDWMKLIPLNPNFPPVMIEDEALEHCHVLGVPVELVRHFE